MSNRRRAPCLYLLYYLLETQQVVTFSVLLLPTVIFTTIITKRESILSLKSEIYQTSRRYDSKHL